MAKLSDHEFPESFWKAFGKHLGEEEEEEEEESPQRGRRVQGRVKGPRHESRSPQSKWRGPEGEVAQSLAGVNASLSRSACEDVTGQAHPADGAGPA